MPHAPHPSQAPTDPLARRSFSWREILAAVGPIALLIGGWAHGKLWGLDTRTTILETQRAADVRSGEQAETRRDPLQGSWAFHQYWVWCWCHYRRNRPLQLRTP